MYPATIQIMLATTIYITFVIAPLVHTNFFVISSLFRNRGAYAIAPCVMNAHIAETTVATANTEALPCPLSYIVHASGIQTALIV